MTRANISIFQLVINITFIGLIIIVIGKINLNINFLYLFCLIGVITSIDLFFLSKIDKICIEEFTYFNINRCLIFIIGYLVFYFAYYYPHNGIISVIEPDKYFDSGMYVYVAKNLYNGLSVSETDFALYYGTNMSPNWALIVYIYTGMFHIFGLEEKILPMINLYIYSYLFFFFIYILKKSEFSDKNKYILTILIMLLPGPIYWTATLSKEVIYYLFLAIIIYTLISSNETINKKLVIITSIASLFSRFNIVAIVIFSKIMILLKCDSKILFLKNLIKIYVLILCSFIFMVLLLRLFFDINFFETGMYIPEKIDVIKSWGYKMDFVPMSITELFYKLPIKFFLTIFSEINILHLFNFPFGNTNTYAIVFNTFQGAIRVIFIILFFIDFCNKENISVLTYKLAGFTFIFWLLFAISIGFFQARYILFGDYLLILSYILLKNKTWSKNE